jgi:uncharacterized protein
LQVRAWHDRTVKLRDTLRPTLNPGEPDHYTPTISALPENLAQYRATVAELLVYPVKALDGISVVEARPGPCGLETEGGFRDRSAAIVRWDEGKQQWERFTQREAPELSRIAGEMLSPQLLRYSSPDDSLAVQLQDTYFAARDGEPVSAHMHGKDFAQGTLEGASEPLTLFIRNVLAQYATRFREDLGNIRVLLPRRGEVRDVPETHTGGVHASTLFSDVSQLLLLSQGTVQYLDRHIDPPVPAYAYRPNIIVGWPANLEDLVGRAIIKGEYPSTGRCSQLTFGVPSTRCPVTTVNPETGEFRKDGEPLKSLVKLRPRRDGKTTMGINVATDASSHWIRTGDIIRPTAEKEEDAA